MRLLFFLRLIHVFPEIYDFKTSIHPITAFRTLSLSSKSAVTTSAPVKIEGQSTKVRQNCSSHLVIYFYHPPNATFDPNPGTNRLRNIFMHIDTPYCGELALRMN